MNSVNEFNSLVLMLGKETMSQFLVFLFRTEKVPTTDTLKLWLKANNIGQEEVVMHKIDVHGTGGPGYGNPCE